MNQAVEILLVIALVAHAWMLTQTAAAPSEPGFALQTDSHR